MLYRNMPEIIFSYLHIINIVQFIGKIVCINWGHFFGKCLDVRRKLMVSFIVMVNIPVKIPMGHTHYLDARDSAHLVSFNPSKIGFHSTLCLVWRIQVFKIFNIFEYSTAINMKIIII